MPQTQKPPAARAPVGCLLAIATPFFLFGLIMLAATIGQLTGGGGVGAVKYGLAALAGLGIGVGVIRGRNVDPSSVSRYPPFAFYYAVGGTFLLIGLLVLRTALSYPGVAGDEALGYGIIVAALLIMGSWFLIGGRVRTSRDAPLVAALECDDPEPWRYVSRWADGKARDSGVRILSRQVFAAVVLNAVTWPIAITWTVSPGQPAGPLGVAVWLLPIGAVVMAVRAARDIRRRIKHGGATFTMDPFPGVVGGSLAGIVWARTTLEDTSAATFTATLTSLRRRESIGSRRQRVSMQRISEQRQTVPAQIYRREGVSYIGVPVSFEIPISARPTTLDDPGNRVLWRLELTSDLPSVGFRTEMEVPVFDLRDETARALEVPDLPAISGVAVAGDPGERTWDQGLDYRPPPTAPRPADEQGLRRRLFPPRAWRFQTEEDPSGRITVRSESGQPDLARVALALFATSALGLLLIIRTPALQEIGGIGLVPIWAGIGSGWMWLSYRHRVAEVVLSTFDITLRTWSVKEGAITLAYDQIESVSVETGVERTRPHGSTVNRAIAGYDIMITTHDGPTYFAGLRAPDRQRAQWVAGSLNRRIAATSRTT